MAAEIELGGHRYQIGRMSAMQQFHVSRRIATVLPPLIRTYLDLQSSDIPLTKNLKLLATSIEPVMDALSHMRDDEAEYVVGACLRVVERQHANGWARVWSTTQNVCMFDDIDMGAMLTLAGHVIVGNLGSFIQGLLTSLASSPTEATPAG
ncbi:hypothetical protein C7405_101646 [Paraburkholderia caballeronis]|uniref:phage tail assembly chaperone n=1 Tax=Paraburkholderia caballeronis TaxID=416943 RepID=UPI001066C54C|nr:hypothetical protein [Paraburkholderia caballeronis]TDV39527.1 hypothetical protein C7405_101646 [Paraburkholderia caballeronis]